jgi:hypothetical protein
MFIDGGKIRWLIGAAMLAVGATTLLKKPRTPKASEDAKENAETPPRTQPDPCHGLNSRVDWQFHLHSGEGHHHGFRQGSPLIALFHLAGSFRACRYDAAQGKLVCIDGLNERLLEILIEGQANDEHVQRVYRRCYESLHFLDFFERVVSSAGDRGSDFDEVARQLQRHARKESESISDARNAWQMATNVKDPQAAQFFRIKAMFHLLAGQRRDSRAMQLYRACYRDDAQRLFRLVKP